jgi:GH35 family endo-1,4-beta-xylanase
LVHRLAVRGAELLREHSNDNALAAANSYIRNFRRGPARVKLDGIAPGTSVKLALDRHAFGFGANIPFAENKLIPKVVPPGSDAERFQRLLLDHFNTVVLSNGGKWVYHEAERDQVQLAYVDRFLEFASEHGLTARMHTLIWDTEQQPAWVVSNDTKSPGLLTRAHGGDASAKRELLEEIDERIEYYVEQRARHYQELDVLNESLHRPRYYQVLGDDGLAELFRKVDAAVKAGSGSTRLYLNEYNLLQWSTNPLAPDAGPDPYANWYRRHAEAVLARGGPLSGLGVQYYADGRSAGEIGDNAHSAARILGVLQNLSGVGPRLTLSEFAVNPGNLPPDRGADVLEETLRVAFGTPKMDAFLIWATWANAAQKPPPLSILMDGENALTPAGVRYEALMREWDTELELPVGPDGSIEFVGFFGRYSLRAGAETRCFELSKGTREYSVTRADRAAAKSGGPRQAPCVTAPAR